MVFWRLEQSPALEIFWEPLGELPGGGWQRENHLTDHLRAKIYAEFAPLSVDMKTAAITHVCYVHSITVLSIRCITNAAKHGGLDYFI